MTADPAEPAAQKLIRERAVNLLAAIDAQRAGKSIQFKPLGTLTWVTCDDVEICWNDGYEYRAKPWTLPELPPGQAWHRTDGWQQEMLPDGYRPLLADERPIENEDEMLTSEPNTWHVQYSFVSKTGREIDGFARTRRPLT